MMKIVKGKIQKFYCDECGKNIFDYIPDKSSAKMEIFGKSATYMNIKKYCEYKNVGMINPKHYCLECYKKVLTKQNVSSIIKLS